MPAGTTPTRAPPARRHRSAARLSALQLSPASNRCRPSPCDRLSRSRSTTATPPHPRSSVDGGPVPPAAMASPTAGTTTGGSRVHCCSLDRGGAWLCPCGLAVPTPQTFSTTIPGLGFTNPTKFPNATCWGRATPGPDPPGSSRSSVERLYNISSSRTPLDPCSPGPRHLAVLTHPGFVGAAPTLPGTSRVRLPPATAGCYDSPPVQVSHLHSNSSASRRRKPALNAFATTFADRWPAAETY
jgi:hypothetical protein